MSDAIIQIGQQVVEVDLVGGVGPAGGAGANGAPGAPGAPGVNGGVGSSAGYGGLFNAAAGMAVGTGITRVKLSGYSIAGLGGADYIYDAAVTAGTVTANPRTQFLAADGRGFRLDLEQRLTPEMFGAIGNCTSVGVGTDDYAALQAALTFAASATSLKLHLSSKRYRCSARLVVREGVSVEGVGHFENPGIVAGASYPGVMSVDGSLIVFDNNVAGMILYAHNDAESAATYDTFTTNAQKFLYKSASKSVLKNFMFWGGGETGTSLVAHGIEVRTTVRMENVRCDHFSANGFFFDGSGHTETTPYGFPDLSICVGLVARQNGMHGIRVRGNDANVISFYGGDTGVNGGVGLLDQGQLGNGYYTFHSATNNQSFGAVSAKRDQLLADWAGLSDQYAGSYVTTSTVGAHIFSGCYIEGGTGFKAEILRPSVVIGGNLAAAANLTTVSTAFIVGANELINVDTLEASNSGIMSIKDSDLTVERATGNVIVKVRPVAGNFSNIQMQGVGLTANGMDILAGGGVGYFSSGEFIFRNAEQSVTYGAINANGLSIGANKVVGPRGAAIPDTTGATLAALEAEVNKMKAALRAATGHGLIA